MSDTVPTYTFAQAIGVCLEMSQRCLAEIRALARAPGPPGSKGECGPAGEQGEAGAKGEQGAAGQDGKDAPSITIRGTFNAETEYRYLDVVMTGGSSFVARTDKPGPCPGDGWQLYSSAGRAGKPGQKGERGERGERGQAAPTIVDWKTDLVHYRATPIMSDGSKAPPLELRGFFEQFQIEAG